MWLTTELQKGASAASALAFQITDPAPSLGVWWALVLGFAMRHLEIHICTREGDRVVTAPAPTIMVTSGSKTTMVPVAEMEGIGQGVKDFHFGNDVELMRGHRYTVEVRVAHERAVFHVTPGSG